MTNRQKNVASQGKDPGSQKVEIPEHLYNSLQGLISLTSADTMQEYLMFLLTEAEMNNSMDGRYYSRLTDFVFTLMVLFKTIERYIPADYEEKRVA